MLAEQEVWRLQVGAWGVQPASQHKELITNPGNTDRMMQMITGYWVTQVVHAATTYCN